MPKRRNRKQTNTPARILFLLFLIAGSIFLYRKLSPPDVVNTEFEGIRELPSGFACYGIDISHYQGEIDWPVFFDKADSIIQFVYCKATEGVSYVDDKWEQNCLALRSNKFKFGAYHFFIPETNATLQADHFLNHYVPEQDELPPVLDVETEGTSDEILISRVKEWLKLVEEKTGRRPIIYTSYHFYKTKFRKEFKDYHFWIANYSDRPDRMKDENILHWQYSDKGKVPGIQGPVDLNFSKIDFTK